MFVFWVVTPCRLVGRYRRFGEVQKPNISIPIVCFLIYIDAEEFLKLLPVAENVLIVNKKKK
jgi:hypothetical protein